VFRNQFDKNQTNFWEIIFEYFANFILLLDALLFHHWSNAIANRFSMTITTNDQDASTISIIHGAVIQAF